MKVSEEVSYYCSSCEKLKPWYCYKFPMTKYSLFATCFECQGLKKSLYFKSSSRDIQLEIIQFEKTIKTLANMADKNRMTQLRDNLFEAMEKVRDGQMDIQKAKAMCEIGQCLINSLKVEIDYIKAVGGTIKSDFLQIENAS